MLNGASVWPAIRQLLLFTMIPFVCWLVKARENDQKDHYVQG